MDLQHYIKSGIIDSYCLGFTSPDENQEVERMAASHPGVQAEIDLVRKFISDGIVQQAIMPSRKVKDNVFKTIYRQEATHQQEFVPLLDELSSVIALKDVLAKNSCAAPQEDFDNLFIQPLPSTREITNLAIWVKQGHEKEIHEDMHEFIAIINGSCIMKFEGSGSRPYVAGDVIHIPPGLFHSASVTSVEPMMAIVQRQYFLS
ncbi:MAG: cupin domain-containing protein [Ferruginibacter sp.]